jgi:hypothetical protein
MVQIDKGLLPYKRNKHGRMPFWKEMKPLSKQKKEDAKNHFFSSMVDWGFDVLVYVPRLIGNVIKGFY